MFNFIAIMMSATFMAILKKAQKNVLYYLLKLLENIV
jgi:hypothetical protein